MKPRLKFRHAPVPALLPMLLGVMVAVSACAARPEAPAAGATPASQPVTQQVALQTFDSAWSRIEATHYDTAFAAGPWARARDEFRPQAAAARELNELRGVIGRLLEQLGESHFVLIPGEAADALGDATAVAEHVSGDAGMAVRLVDGELVVWQVEAGGAAADAGVRIGWTVESIDGRPVSENLARVLSLPDAERRLASMRLLYQVNGWFEGAVGDDVALRLRDDAGRSVERRVTLREGSGEMIRFGNLPPMRAWLDHQRVALRQDGAGCIGVVRMNVWMVPLMPQFDRAVDALRDCAGIVLDLRGNPGGVAGMVMGTAGHFLQDTLALGVMRTRTSELRFKANPRRVSPTGQPVEPFGGALAIITDEMSASTTEIFAAGLQGVQRARVFGGQSAGQALPAMMVRLPTNDVLMHAIADFTGPGRRPHRGRRCCSRRTRATYPRCAAGGS
jgi:carboxyl-terminal processing protease